MKAGQKVDPHRLTQVGRALRELGIRMIPAYSPQARGRCERSFGTWQNRLPQELRLEGISDLAAANEFLRERYLAEFYRMFARPPAERGTAFGRCGRKDLDQVFSIQTERTVAKDNTVAIGDRFWQLNRTPFRRTLAGSTVTICEHLDATVSVHWGPHVLGRFHADGEALENQATPRRGKGGSGEAGENQKQVSTGSPTSLEISPTARDSHFPTAPTAVAGSKRNGKTKAARAA